MNPEVPYMLNKVRFCFCLLQKYFKDCFFKSSSITQILDTPIKKNKEYWPEINIHY